MLFRSRIRVSADAVGGSGEVVSFRGVDLPPAPVGALVAWGNGYDLPLPSTETDERCAAVRLGTPADLLAARIEACWPAMGSEIVAGETIPAETGIVGVAVSFTKGCYPGQELVERMDSRGSRAPWHLVTVDVADGTRVGDAVHAAGAAIGSVTSVSGTRAIARVRRAALDPSGS